MKKTEIGNIITENHANQNNQMNHGSDHFGTDWKS